MTSEDPPTSTTSTCINNQYSTGPDRSETQPAHCDPHTSDRDLCKQLGELQKVEAGNPPSEKLATLSYVMRNNFDG